MAPEKHLRSLSNIVNMDLPEALQVQTFSLFSRFFETPDIFICVGGHGMVS